MGWDGAVYQWKVLGLDEKGEAGGGVMQVAVFCDSDPELYIYKSQG